jgi:ribosomal protein L37AE/L43A
MKTPFFMNNVVCVKKEASIMAEKKLVKPHCPSCGSSQILYRIRTDDFVCRICGHNWSKTIK